MNYYYKKNKLFISIFLLVNFLLFAEIENNFINLDELEPKWQTVLGGSVIGEPVYSSYGFCVVLDGRSIASITGDGKIYWQKSFRGNPSKHISVTKDDFVYFISDENQLNFLNPNGFLLWKIETPEIVTTAPKCGRDGRVFITGKNSLSCYGLNGKTRFTIFTDDSSNIPLQELPDGSLLFFMEKKVNNCSTALRISPYGKIMEEIIFTGIVNCALETNFGVLLGFLNGNMGLCSVKNDTAVSLWTMQLNLGIPIVFAVDNTNAFVLMNNCVCVSFNLGIEKPENILWKYYIEDFNLIKDEKLTTIISSNTVTFVGKKSIASLKFNGTLDFQSNLNEKNFYAYTPWGNILEFNENWIVSSFSLRNYYTKNTKSVIKTPRNYSKNWLGKNIYAYETFELINLYKIGNFGSAETDYITVINAKIQELSSYYIKDIKERYTLENDFPIDYRNSIIELLGETGCTNFSYMFAQILRQETDVTLILTALKSIEKHGFDYDGTILTALDEIVQRKARYNRQNLIPLCDAVFSICKVMGKPAIFSKGKSILSRLNSRYFDSNIKDYAQKTLKKLIALQI
ncbi:MAG: hypothetical protein GX220_05240 [Treponema sp.]|nr:hypothetical protein [Treponema sp.]